MNRAGGYTLVEALVALVLGVLVVHVAWRAAAVHAGATYTLFERAQMLESARISGWVLRSELEAGTPDGDWTSGPDSVSLRAFRALAVSCPAQSGPGSLVVAVEGMREADPTKDSVLVLWPDGAWRAHAIESSVSHPGCPNADAPAETWRLDPAAGGLLARLYERGSYHVSDGAFRYRRGRGGRQPLTPRGLAEESALRFEDGSAVLDLRPTRDPAEGWRVQQKLWPSRPRR